MIVGKIKWPGFYICAGMATWGVISALMAVVHNYIGLLMARFFLGFVEAIFFPGALYFLSLFYSRQQFALRTAILYSGSQLGNAFGGLFAIGILRLDDHHGLEGWRWVSHFVWSVDKYNCTDLSTAFPDRGRTDCRPRHHLLLDSAQLEQEDPVPLVGRVRVDSMEPDQRSRAGGRPKRDLRLEGLHACSDRRQDVDAARDPLLRKNRGATPC